MDGDDLRDRLRAAAAWLDATPAETAGLLMLLLGAVAVGALVWWQGRAVPIGAAPPADGAATAVAAPEGEAAVTVHVAGAVSAPGLVTVGAGARVADAIAAAGGATVGAVLDGLNLARRVTDGERIEVPRLGPSTPAHEQGPDGSGARRSDGRLDLNRATAAELETLPGVGPVLAGRILAWRDEHGPFREPGQLREVPGIGERTFQQLAELVAV